MDELWLIFSVKCVIEKLFQYIFTQVETDVNT